MNNAGLMEFRRSTKQRVINKFLSNVNDKPTNQFKPFTPLNRTNHPLLTLRQRVLTCNDNTEIVYVSKRGDVHNAVLRRMGQKRFSIVYQGRHYTTLYTFFLATGDCTQEFTDMGQITFVAAGEKNNNIDSENQK